MAGYCEGGKRQHTSHSEDLSELKNMIDKLNLDKSQVKHPHIIVMYRVYYIQYETEMNGEMRMLEFYWNNIGVCT